MTENEREFVEEYKKHAAKGDFAKAYETAREYAAAYLKEPLAWLMKGTAQYDFAQKQNMTSSSR